MGHTNIRSIVEGTSPSNAYNKRYNEDEVYYGHQEGYSGHFNAFEGLSKYRKQLVSSNDVIMKLPINQLFMMIKHCFLVPDNH
jgi:hypothetical protein